MADKSLLPEDIEMWDRYKKAWNNLLNSRASLFRKSSNITEVVRYGLKEHVNAALELAEMLKEDDLKSIFGELLFGASYFNANTQTFEKLVLSLSRDWLRENIEKYAEPILSLDEPYEECGRLLYIYEQIDPTLEIKLAKRLSESEDEEIGEIGNYALGKYQDE